MDTTAQNISNLFAYMMETSKLESKEAYTDIKEIITKILNYNSFIYPNVDIKPIQFNNNKKIFVRLNTLQFDICFKTFLNNAVEAMVDKKDKEISVKIALITDNKLEIRVTDNGCGIDKIAMNRLFEFGFSGKDKTRWYGTGLGLYSAKNYIENHLNGLLTIESTLGEGTTVVIKLPYTDKIIEG